MCTYSRNIVPIYILSLRRDSMNKHIFIYHPMRNLILITILILWFTSPVGAQKEGVIKNYIHISKKEGISNNNVKAIQDDVYGRIWIGTEMGLNIYSSSRLVKPEHYMGVNVCSLLDTGTEMLIGTHGFLESYNYETGVYTRIKDGKNEVPYIFSIIRVKDKIIVISGETAYTYENGSLTLINYNLPCFFLSVDKFNVIWGFKEDMVYRFDEQFNVQKSYKIRSVDLSPLTVICMHPDSKGCVWLGTEKDGLYRYNRVQDEFFHEDLMAKYGISAMGNIGSINEDEYDRLWIGHSSGLSVYDYTNNYLKFYMLENNYNIQLVNIITRIFRTKRQEMILGTHFTGLFLINELNSAIRFYHLSGWGEKMGGVTVNGITKDGQGNLLVATNYLGVNMLDQSGKVVRQFNYRNSGINDNVIALECDKKGNIWAGSASDGLYKIDRNLQVTRHVNRPNDSTSMSGKSVHALYSINEDSLLVATNKGIDIYHYERNAFENIIASKNQDYAFTNILPYRDKIYAVHFKAIFCIDRTTKEITEYNMLSYKNLFIQSAYIDKTGRLWLGSSKGELYYLEDGKPIQFIDNKEHTESLNNIRGDSLGNLWITAGNTLLFVPPSKDVRVINLAWGLGNNEFNVRSCYTDAKGDIYLGTSNGLIGFDPMQIISQEKEEPVLYIADFKLFDKTVQPGASSLLKKHINHTDELVLEHKENFLSFVVNSIDYDPARSTPYRCLYRLENFDNNWYEINPASNEIIFTRLATGKYKLHVRLQAETGETLDEKTIAIRIKPPVWLSTPIIILYILIFAAVIWWISRVVKRRRATRELIEKVKRESDEETRLNAMKLDFFTYISHEFKTPLAIISTLQNEILPYSDNEDDDTEIFKRNIKRLEYLISQLMEFRNMESQHASISLKQVDMIPFLRGIYEAFVPLYKYKEISHEFITDMDSLPMMIDADKIEMLVGNLLSNVSKHTAQGGRFYIKASRDNEKLVIDVFNSAECLTDEQKSAIFQPYNKTDASSLYSNSGIGLAIVNSIAKLLDIHLSVIAVENAGNIFRVEIPIVEGKGNEASSEVTYTNIVDRIIDNTMYFEEQSGAPDAEEEARNPFQILVVDNDHDTKKILKKKLQEYFHVLTASNGKEALLLLKSQNVDVVISDIMMPEMDGYELCKAIKGNSKTKHIPVILITSDLSAEGKIKGFQAGTDAFLYKPINIQELLLRLENILKNKHVLRTYYSSFGQMNMEEKEVNNADETFIKELTDYIHDHLSDSELSVQQLAQHVNISRTQLYLNIKRLTEQTPSQFVLNIKMAQARKMILNTNMTSSEISYKLGYCNPNHFSRQFKEFYGTSPSEFRKKEEADK